MATKEFRCANVGYSECNWRLEGDSEDAMVPQVMEHAAEVHHLELKDEAIQHVRNAIRDKPSA